MSIKTASSQLMLCAICCQNKNNDDNNCSRLFVTAQNDKLRGNDKEIRKEPLFQWARF